MVGRPHARPPDEPGSAWLAFCVLALAACSEPQAGGSKTKADATADLGDDAGLSETVADTPDASNQPRDAAPLSCPGASGCPCATNGDCNIGLCLATPDGQRCVRPCNPDCPKDFECVPWGAGDLVNVCVYVRGELCDPCQSSAACQGPGHSDAQCVRYGDLGSFCGLSCTANSECGDGWLCRSVASIEGTASKQCVRGPGDAGGEFGLCPCSKVAVSKGLATACLAGFVAADGGKVSCGGSRKCAKEGSDGLTACNAPLPAT